MRRFEGRAAIVSGASRGIGRAIAMKLAAEGARVLVNYHQSRQGADEVAAAVNEAGSEALVVQADVSAAADVERLVQEALGAFGRVDVLVNNAGITRDQLLLRMSEEDWDTVLDTNLKSAFLLSRAVARPMLKQRAGRIVNITSVSGILGNPGQANYSASKAGMIGLTRSVARELASRNVTCNAVAAGVVDTEIWDKVSAEALNAMLGLVPLGRKGTPDDIAEAVLFLASDAAGYITGQVLNVDGGMVMA